MIKFNLLICFLFFNLNSSSVLASSGEKLFKACITCHGAQGMGNKALKAPRLAGQYDWYIESTLLKFKSGERKNPVMKPILKNLTNDDFKILASYISKM